MTLMMELKEQWREGREEGRKEGIREGRKEGREEGIIVSLKNVMKKLKLSLDEAMEWMEIPINKRAIYKAKLLAE